MRYNLATDEFLNKTIAWIKDHKVVTIVLLLITVSIIGVCFNDAEDEEVITGKIVENYSEDIISEKNISENVDYRKPEEVENNSDDVTIPKKSSYNSFEDNTYDCSSNVYNCNNFSSSSEAQYVFELCGENDIHDLDRDGDGKVCEWLD